MNIPNKDSFYFVLFPKFLYILSSRRDELSQTIKALDLTLIQPSYMDP